jgi:hypothetical protein
MAAVEQVLTLADRVKAMCDTHSGEFTRSPQADGTVIVRLIFPAGDVISGAGANTAAALEQLELRVAAFTANLVGL